jgi:hypothetical protein
MAPLACLVCVARQVALQREERRVQSSKMNVGQTTTRLGLVSYRHDDSVSVREDW